MTMPEGYTLIDEYGNGRRFYVLKQEDNRLNSLKNSAGKMKLFHSDVKAIEYSLKHKKEGLRADQILTR